MALQENIHASQGFAYNHQGVHWQTRICPYPNRIPNVGIISQFPDMADIDPDDRNSNSQLATYYQG